ncbi:hypothetical protein niasHS_006380 [Heterodera schachtii]|uniref:Uncharacterized protein n=1 Tax=Heterodera schachtii TaxID=97005 RepID=A0ABD2JWU7_HETSC
MSDDFNRLMSSNSIHNITQETDTCDIEPWIEDWHETPKARSHTTPSEFYQCMSNNSTRIEIEKPKQQQQKSTSGGGTSLLFRRMSSNDIDDSHFLKDSPTPWEEQQQLPFDAMVDRMPPAGWHLPTKTDMATPQANMLTTLRGRLRSIVLTKAKMEFGPSEAHGMRRAYRSHTDLNEEEEAAEEGRGGSGKAQQIIIGGSAGAGGGGGSGAAAVPMPKVIRDSAAEKIGTKSSSRDGTTDEARRKRRASPSVAPQHGREADTAVGGNRRQSAAVQSLNAPISFHDLSACLISSTDAAQQKVFRSRAKSEAMNVSRKRRENIYKEKQREEKEEEAGEENCKTK